MFLKKNFFYNTLNLPSVKINVCPSFSYDMVAVALQGTEWLDTLDSIQSSYPFFLVCFIFAGIAYFLVIVLVF